MVRAQQGVADCYARNVLSRVDVVDAVPINDELDLLALRLEYLSPYVDRFFVAESSHTFTGVPKPLHVTENINRFAAYADRLEIVTYGAEGDATSWERERLARSALRNSVSMLPGDTVVLHGDADEFPSRTQLAALRAVESPVVVPLETFYRRANWRLEADTPLLRVKAMPVRDLPADMHALRMSDELEQMQGAPGAHLSYMGFSPGDMAAKLLAFSHTEFQFAVPAAERVLAVSDALALDHFGRSTARGRGVLSFVGLSGESELHTWLRSRRPQWFGDRPVATRMWREMSAAALDEAMSSSDVARLNGLGVADTLRSRGAHRALVRRSRQVLGQVRRGRLL